MSPFRASDLDQSFRGSSRADAAIERFSQVRKRQQQSLHGSRRTATELVNIDFLASLIRPHPEPRNESAPTERLPVRMSFKAALPDQSIDLLYTEGCGVPNVIGRRAGKVKRHGILSRKI